MKKTIIVFGLLIVIVFSVAIYAQSFWGGKVLSASKTKAKWGNETFDLKKFKEGSYEVKAKMAYSIMTNKNLIGKSYENIRETFGPNDGFYFIDTYPAYIIQKGKNHSEETWQLVFRMDSQYNVRDIIMHRNCCEK